MCDSSNLAENKPWHSLTWAEWHEQAKLLKKPEPEPQERWPGEWKANEQYRDFIIEVVSDDAFSFLLKNICDKIRDNIGDYMGHRYARMTADEMKLMKQIMDAPRL
jgi:hypothetical protein